MITQPKVWEPYYRLNTCVNENCGHYLHDGPCLVKDCTCKDGVGRFVTFNATQARTKTCWHGVRPSTNCKICEYIRRRRGEAKNGGRKNKKTKITQ